MISQNTKNCINEWKQSIGGIQSEHTDEDGARIIFYLFFFHQPAKEKDTKLISHGHASI